MSKWKPCISHEKSRTMCFILSSVTSPCRPSGPSLQEMYSSFIKLEQCSYCWNCICFCFWVALSHHCFLLGFQIAPACSTRSPMASDCLSLEMGTLLQTDWINQGLQKHTFHYIKKKKWRLSWGSLDQPFSGTKNLFMCRAYTKCCRQCAPYHHHTYTHKKPKVFMTPMFQRSHSDFYSLLCHVKCPYQLSPSHTFIWLRWFKKKKKKHGGDGPELWPHRRVHTNVNPITSFLFRATHCLNSSTYWRAIHWLDQEWEEGGKEWHKINGSVARNVTT